MCRRNQHFVPGRKVPGLFFLRKATDGFFRHIKTYNCRHLKKEGEKIMDEKYYTADMEEPDCMRCANVTADGACKYCGPEYGWNEYYRMAEMADEEE